MWREFLACLNHRFTLQNITSRSNLFLKENFSYSVLRETGAIMWQQQEIYRQKTFFDENWWMLFINSLNAFEADVCKGHSVTSTTTDSIAYIKTLLTLNSQSTAEKKLNCTFYMNHNTQYKYWHYPHLRSFMHKSTYYGKHMKISDSHKRFISVLIRCSQHLIRKNKVKHD